MKAALWLSGLSAGLALGLGAAFGAGAAEEGARAAAAVGSTESGVVAAEAGGASPAPTDREMGGAISAPTDRETGRVNSAPTDKAVGGAGSAPTGAAVGGAGSDTTGVGSTGSGVAAPSAFGSEAAIEWLGDPAEARRRARAENRPLFIYAFMDASAACIEQEEAFADPQVRKALGTWVCLRLDMDARRADALKLRIVGAPSFRAVTALGAVVAAQNGGLPAGDMAAWLADNGMVAVATAERAVSALNAEKLDEASIAAIVKLLGDRQREAREAAIERLSRDPEACAVAVVVAFMNGGLATKLSAYEILSAWEAPLDGIDPWQPETTGATGAAGGSITAWAARGEFAMALPTRSQLDRDFEVLAGDDDERAQAAMTRLSRVGPDLVTETRRRLADEARDIPRARLVALRYRLVMPPDLPRAHPELVNALVSQDAAERAHAVDQIAKMPGNLEPLFLELFQDPEPLVREVALKALRRSAGKAADKTLAQLLSDPQPNVRAQVLNELANKPSADVVTIIAEYVKTEKDEDLLGHAVRALAGMKAKSAGTVLASMARHPAWQVRADVAEALGKRGNYGYSSRKPPAEVSDALKALLADEDSFVVSKAIEAISASGMEATSQLADVAARQPELAVPALEAMAGGDEKGKRAVPYLRKFLANSDPRIRAAALTAIVTSTEASISNELDAAFEDSDTQVRQAALSGVGRLALKVKPVPVEFVRKWREPVEGRLAAEEPRERLEAAVALANMRLAEKALPALEALAARHEEFRGEVAECMQYLDWPKRKDLFDGLVRMGLDQEAYGQAVEGLAGEGDVQAAPTLWEQLDTNPMALECLSVMQGAILQAYLGDDRWNPSRWSGAVTRRVSQEAAKRLETGDERTRTLALSMLTMADKAGAAQKAEAFFTAADTPPAMRRNALAVLMLIAPKAQVARAVEACASDDESMAKLGVAFLAEGNSSTYCRSLEVNDIEIYMGYGSYESYKPEKAPDALSPATLAPLLSRSDAYTRAAAGYLMARRGDISGVNVLAAAWRDGGGQTERTFLVDAVVSLGDDSLTATLEEVYGSFDREESEYEVGSFYWKIRALQGPKVLALRKRIRDEVGMDTLRRYEYTANSD